MQVLATKIEGLAQDITEMRASVVKMTDALVKFAVIEERQTQTILAQDRITMTIDRVSFDSTTMKSPASCRKRNCVHWCSTRPKT